MKIGIYNPYFDSISGGERYTLALASHWSGGHAVDVFWDDPAILAKAQDRLHLDLTKVRVVPNVFRKGNLLKKLFVSRTYDLIFFLSDGSVPTSLAKYNILHFQMPFPSVSAASWKLGRYDAVVCNSIFTKRNLDVALQSKAVVIYPPVVTAVSGEAKKEKIILTVGRFHPVKKQGILIDVFKKLAKKKEYEGWRFVCVGGLLPADNQYFESLKKVSGGYPIELIPNGPFNELESLYRKASIYWHAAGYGETDPCWMEHFGITTVEAMSAGAVPIVYAGGGQQEVVGDGINGYLWHTVDELIGRTTEMMCDTRKREAMGMQAQKRALVFGESKFTQAFDDLLMNITLHCGIKDRV